MANLVGFPEENCEPLHVVKYTGGQEYWPHNDFIENHKYLSCGGRIATMLVYLTDCADGGATNFPLLDVTIYPKPGTVVLWYNVLPTSDGSHVIVDQRMLHIPAKEQCLVHHCQVLFACIGIHENARDRREWDILYGFIRI